MKTDVDVLAFWFSPEVKEKWWIKDESFDEEIRTQFLETHKRLQENIPTDWNSTPQGMLAAIIVLDQFSRNMFRGKEASFFYDTIALDLAKDAIAKRFDTMLSDEESAFMYMPFMHSENIEDQKESMRLFIARKGLESNVEFALSHKHIIEKFGRYPHRNEILGRTSTPEELTFLEGPNSSF